MTGFLVFLLLCVTAWLILKWTETRERIVSLEARLSRLELERVAPQVSEAHSRPVEVLRRIATPPPIPQPAAAPVSITPSATQPPPTPPPAPPRPVAPEPTVAATMNWEKFFGVKFFAWAGGFILFLAVVFFVKYAFDKNLITPQMQVGVGYLTGLGLMIGSVFLSRQRQVVTIQMLCATGTLILYATTFAAHAYYHFFSSTLSFGLMAMVTISAFYLAVRLNAQVVAVLGLLGGFLTPPLLSTGVDNPVGLFGYIALLDIGLLAVALRQRWHYLTLLAAVATVLMQLGWVEKFYAPAKINIAMTIFLGFAALFVCALAAANRKQRQSHFLSASALLMPFSALSFAVYLLAHAHNDITGRLWFYFGYVFAADVAFLVIVWLRQELRLSQIFAGGLTFLLLAGWTAKYLTSANLNQVLVLYFIFALVHTIFPIAMQRARPETGSIGWAHAFPSLALLLVLLPLFKLPQISWGLWPVVLGLDVLAIALAIVTGSLLAILGVLLLTTFIATGWIFKVPPITAEVPGLMVLIGAFAVFFIAASLFAARKVGAQNSRSASAFGQIGALSAITPFMLLTLVILRLPMANPAPVFGLAALLIVIMLALLRWSAVDALAGVALFSVLMLEHAWHFTRFQPDAAWPALAWYTGFGMIFLGFPFIFQKHFEKRTALWTVSALALPLHFFLIYHVVNTTWPDFDYKGLIPAALAVPCLAALWQIVRTSSDVTLRALFGGVTLFFLTFIFPIQFDRQWLTIGWAVEGVALLALFHKVPHPGLRNVGVGLLAVCFVRLALNPWVITEYSRTGTPIWNWYLYTYGIVAAAMMFGARLLTPPRNKIDLGTRGNSSLQPDVSLNVPPILYGFGTILTFLLLNIEIADIFSDRGAQLTFNFSGSFAQDMAYSLAWAVFAFVLLAIGFKIHNAPTRYSGMALLMFTLLKLFLHDLWRLGGLYRIGSLIGLAIVLILVSFIYQRFLSADKVAKTQIDA
jgi:uncharacterized membrane protein